MMCQYLVWYHLFYETKALLRLIQFSLCYEDLIKYIKVLTFYIELIGRNQNAIFVNLLIFVTYFVRYLKTLILILNDAPA